MSGAIPVYQTTGPARTVVETIKGGQLVEARAAGKVGVAGADSVVVLGVATKDATPASTNQNGTDAVTGLAITNLSPVLSTLTVACEGFWNLKATGAIAFGERVKAAANGTVAKWVVADDDADMIVGRCEAAGGIANGATGLIKLAL